MLSLISSKMLIKPGILKTIKLLTKENNLLQSDE